jgi:hypothetical protein
VVKIVSLYILFSTAFCFSQGFKVRHFIPNSYTGGSRAMFETASGAYFTAGVAADTVNGQIFYRLTTMGLNAQGQPTWLKKYGNNKLKYTYNPFVARSYYKQGAFIYYTGCVVDSNNKQIGALIKFNLDGDTIWQKIYRDTAEDVIPQMVTGSADGGFLITGIFQNASEQPCLLIKTDANGKELWRKRISKVTPNVIDGKAIIQDSATKKIVIGGYQYIGNASNWTGYFSILVLDSLGVKISHFNILGVTGALFDLIQTRDKNIVVVGLTQQSSNGNTLCRGSITKFNLNNPSFTIIWNNMSFDKLSITNAFSCIRELNNGDLIVGGIYDTLQNMNILPQTLTRLVCFSSNGVVKWKRYYNYWPSQGQANYNSLVSLEISQNGGLYGTLFSNNSSPTPFMFIKWDSLGCDTDAAWCRMVALGTEGYAKSKNKLSIFPNPALDKIQISWGELSISQGVISIKNVTGLEVKRLVFDEALSSFEMDVSDLKPGLYFIDVVKDRQVFYSDKFVKS